MNKFSVTIFTYLLIAFCGTAYAAQDENKEKNAMSQAKQISVIERNNYASLTPPVGPYSHAVKHNNTLYLSGFTAYGTEAQGKGMAEQARAIFDQLKAIAKAEGIDMQSLIKVTVFITDFNQAQELRQELFKQYDGNLPASSLVEVAKLFSPEVNIEIEAVFGL